MAPPPLYPLRFEPIFKRMIWGGRRLHTLLEKPIGPEDGYAESWEVSDHGQDVSRVCRGAAGRHHPPRPRPRPAGGASRPGAGARAAIPPAREVPRRPPGPLRPGPSRRRTRPPPRGRQRQDGGLGRPPRRAGQRDLRRPADRASPGSSSPRRWRRARSSRSCIASRRRPGDCIMIPAGTVHAIGAGVVLAEIQQMSDATFRVHDWGRVGARRQASPAAHPPGDRIDRLSTPVPSTRSVRTSSRSPAGSASVWLPARTSPSNGGPAARRGDDRPDGPVHAAPRAGGPGRGAARGPFARRSNAARRLLLPASIGPCEVRPRRVGDRPELRRPLSNHRQTRSRCPTTCPPPPCKPPAAGALWLRLPRALGLATDGRKLLLATVGLMVMWAGWDLLDRLFPHVRRDHGPGRRPHDDLRAGRSPPSTASSRRSGRRPIPVRMLAAPAAWRLRGPLQQPAIPPRIAGDALGP